MDRGGGWKNKTDLMANFLIEIFPHTHCADYVVFVDVG